MSYISLFFWHSEVITKDGVLWIRDFLAVIDGWLTEQQWPRMEELIDSLIDGWNEININTYFII